MSDWCLNRWTLSVLVIASFQCAGNALADGISISCRREEVRSSDEINAGSIHLSHRLLIASSDTVIVGDTVLVPGSDYGIDYARGIIYLSEGIPSSDSIRIKYSVLPFSLKPGYSLRIVEDAPGRSVPIKKVEAGRKRREESYDIRASGSKTISIETGTLRDLSVNQSLSLSIGGSIGDAVQVVGVLSDKDMSLSEQASTSKLKDLDRVFMEVRSPQGYARVGDLEIDEVPGELLKFRRNMTGFFADASHASKRLVASAAASRSSHESVELEGREGIAGPYAVTDPDGGSASIVRNTESVWLDGKPMSRGEGADYTIDYASGEIYFNPRHLIRDGARIVVAYESLNPDGRKQFYFGRSSVGIGERASVAVSFVNETSAPDADETSVMSLGREQQPSSDTWVDGGRFAGPGQGDYIKVEDDTLIYYQYVGEGAGDYDVTFTRVGTGEGSYTYVFSDVWDRYVHVFTGTGAYVDKVRANPPVGAQVFHVSTSAKPVDWLEVTSEVAQSKGHLKDEAGTWMERKDRAYTVGLDGSLELPEIGSRRAGTMDIRVKRRSLGESYIGFDMLRRPDFLEVWAQQPETGGEEASEVELGYRLGQKVNTSFQLGSMETSSGRSRRRKVCLDVGNTRLGVTASAESARMPAPSGTKGIDRNGIGVRVPLKFVQMRFGRAYEMKSRLVDTTSVRREEYYSVVEVSGKNRQVSLSLSRGVEERDRSAGWEPYSASLEGRLEFEAVRGTGVLFRGGVAQRRVDYAHLEAPSDMRITSGDLHLSLRDIAAISSMSFDYRLANTLTTVYGAELVKVAGGGDYDSLGNYVPGAGGYAISRYEKGKEPVTNVKADIVLEVGRKGKVLLDKSLSSRTGINIEGESSASPLERIALLHPGHLLNGDDMVLGRINVTEDLVLRRGKGLTLTLNAQGSRVIDNRCVDRTEQKTITELRSTMVTNGFKHMTVGIEGRITAARSSIEMRSGTIGPARDTWAGTIRLERNISSNVRSRVRLGLLGEERTEPYADFLQASFSPGLTVFAGGLRCDAGCNLRRMLRSEHSTATFPIRDSLDWNSRVGLRHGKYTSLSFEYTGRKTQGTQAIHNLRASVSATF